MGLDSIELLVGIEKYFAIEITDIEAEKLYTVQMMVHSVAKHLGITDESTALRDHLFESVVATIQTSGIEAQKVELSSPISSLITMGDKFDWKAFSKSLGLSVPKPGLTKMFGTRVSEKLKNLLSWTPLYKWEDVTCEQFVAAICANNYLDLIDRNNIKSKYEIYIAVVGITVDKLGVDYYEAGPDKSFTSDLGVD